MANHEALLATGRKKPRFFYGYVVVIAAFFIMVLSSGALSSYGVFFKPLATEFGWTRATTAGAYSMCQFLTGLLFMVTGRLTDRFGPRAVATICGFVLGLGLFLMSGINALWQLYLFLGVIVAVGMSGGLVPLMSTVGRWFIRRRGLMTGIVLGGVGVGQVTMPPVATYLIATYGWRNAYLILGIITMVLSVVVAQFLRRDPAQVGQLPDGETEVKVANLISESRRFSLREAMRTRQFWLLCIAYFSYGFFVHPTLVHMVPHATDLGISAVSAASILSVIGGVGTVGRISAGSAGDRIGHKRGLIIAFIMALVALLWLQLAGELWRLYLFAVVLGFAYGGIVALEAPVAADLFGLRAHGAILGVVHFGATTGAAIGAPLAGRLFDVTGSYQLAFLIFAGLSAVGLISTLFLKPLRLEDLRRKL